MCEEFSIFIYRTYILKEYIAIVQNKRWIQCAAVIEFSFFRMCALQSIHTSHWYYALRKGSAFVNCMEINGFFFRPFISSSCYDAHTLRSSPSVIKSATQKSEKSIAIDCICFVKWAHAVCMLLTIVMQKRTQHTHTHAQIRPNFHLSLSLSLDL